MKKRKRKALASEPTRQKLFIRLLPEVDAKVRREALRHGDLSLIIAAALDAFEISDVASQLPKIGSGTIKTTIMLDLRVRLDLKKVALRCGTSMNAIINGALAAWKPPGSPQVSRGGFGRGYLGGS